MSLSRGHGRPLAAVLATAVAMTAPRVAVAQMDAAPNAVAVEARGIIDDGAAASRDGRFADAARLFAQAAAMRPPDGLEAEARLLQARALAAMARFEDAVVVLDAFLELAPVGPDSFDALLLRGEALVAASATTPHFQEAAVSFSMALETDGIGPDDRAIAALRLSDALLRMGDDVDAAKAVGRLGRRERDTLARLAAAEHNPRLPPLLRRL